MQNVFSSVFCLIINFPLATCEKKKAYQMCFLKMFYNQISFSGPF